jgi:hypothetical protein
MNSDSIEFNQVTVRYNKNQPDTLGQIVFDLDDAIANNIQFGRTYPITQELAERIEEENIRIQTKANELAQIYENYLDSESSAYENYLMGLHDERPNPMDKNYGIRVSEWEEIAHPVPARYMDEAEVGKGLRKRFRRFKR